MSKLSDSIHNSMRDKAKRLTTGEPHAKVDSSTWTPPEMENASIKTGLRPLSKRQYKSGGKVHGADAKKRGDRMARKSGGRTEKEDRAKRYLTPDNLINRDVRMANEAREGIKHVGGFKKGGRIHKNDGGDIDSIAQAIRQAEIEDNMKGRGLPERVPLPPRRPVVVPMKPRERIPNGASPTMKRGGAAEHTDEAQDKKLMHEVLREKAFKASGGKTMHHDDCSCKMCMGGAAKAKKADGGKINWIKKDKEIFSGNSKTKIPGEVPGGRSAHKHGGKAKGKTHININVMPHPAGGAPMAPPMGGPMGGPPMAPPAPPMAPPRPPMGGPQGAPPIDPAMLAMLMKNGGNGGMGGGRPPMAPPMGGGMPMGRKHGGRAMAKTDHVINHAAGGGLGRLEKIKAYGEPQKHMK